MSATVASPQKRQLEMILKRGRWNNKSEIIRHGIELVWRETLARDLSAMPTDELSASYRKLTKEDKAEERKMGKASARPGKGELD